MNRQMELAEQYLEDDYNAGNITLSEYNKEMNELHSSWRAEAEEQAQQAYNDSMDSWGY